MIYIGVKEDTLEGFKYRPTPIGNQQLSTAMMADYTRFEELIHEAVLKNEATEDDTKGHALLNYGPANPIQDRFLRYAAEQLPLLRQVLRNSSLPEHRAAAAWILPFTNNKRTIVADLLAAAHDENETVRNNAVRALAVLGKYAADHPQSGISIPGEDFVAMIRSIVWTDRNKGLAVLEALTRKRDPFILKLLKEKALDEMTEMALWRNEGHAFYAFLLLGRVAGIAEQDILGEPAPTFMQRKELVRKWADMIRTQK